mgnify:CR=1 FL=1
MATGFHLPLGQFASTTIIGKRLSLGTVFLGAEFPGGGVSKNAAFRDPRRNFKPETLIPITKRDNANDAELF